MQKFVYCLLLIAASLNSAAQQSRFIYIQTENKQPFYVKVDKRVFSSSASGYVIIPKLIDGTYNLSIGFPKNESPAQNIQCTIDKKDQGYLLKNFGDKGWGLFNLQTLNVLMAGAGAQNNTPSVVKEEKTDAFSNMLADVVKDPSIKQKDAVVEPFKKEEPEVVKPQEPELKVQPESEVPKEVITRILYNTNTEGTELVYVDKNGDALDTIRIFIPAEKNIEEKTPKKEVKAISENIIDTIAVAPQQPVNNSNSNIKIETTTDSLGNLIGTATIGSTPVKNNICKNIATEDDFIKLRKKMAAADNDDDMVSTAKKIFKTKCFSTTQIKNLSFLFLKDEGKYQFFDAAYPYVSDRQAFKVLQDQLIDEYYINRFKVMIQ
ncbi:DUF4476 domain-containing protein [Ferruginibacter sp. SUN002]|uniref:DUF4476 domain-containing protein n=1 Tax=Ferruginibacter sp. SUN002 TaxID=2937789 RepID=UPI003D35D787